MVPHGRKIGYARVSSTEQTTALQIEALQKAGCELIFEETVSGAKAVRPALDACLDQLRPHGFGRRSSAEGAERTKYHLYSVDQGDLRDNNEPDTLIVWKLDRLGRTAWELSNILHDLELRGIRFKCVTQSFDTGDYLGKFLLGQLGLIAQLERDMLIERSAAGQAIAREKGHFPQRPRVLRGERLQRAIEAYNTRPIDPATGRPMSIAALARQFGVSKPTLLRYVKHGGVPTSAKDRAKFLAKNPDPAAWLEKTDDPLYGRNLDKLRPPKAS